MSSHTNPWVDPADARDRAMSDLAEDIAAREDELSHLRAEYERIQQWRPEPVAQPVVDPRLHGWREEERFEQALK